jgi:hypothetical protein
MSSTVSNAHYRLLAAGGGEMESGAGEVTVTGGVLELRPRTGAALRLPPERIASVSEPQPFVVLLTLADGTGVELSRLAAMRTQLLEELRDARAAAGARETGTVGDAVRFTGTAGPAAADLYVHEDALLVMAGGQPQRIAFAFVIGVRAQDHSVTITIGGADPIVVSRLGRRTDEFVSLLGERLGAARSRTAAFLASLLPGLDPMAQRAAAGLLRDGVAAPATALNAIHPDLFCTLLQVATLPDRFAAISQLTGGAGDAAGHAAGTGGPIGPAIGFKQLTSVRRPAVGAVPWHDPAAAPHIGEHESPGGLFGPGLGGALAAGVMSGLGPGNGFGFGHGGLLGDFGGYWAFRALGAGLGGANMSGANAGVQHQMTPRANVSHGRLTPETEDLSALTTSGNDPTILAFALLAGPSGGRVAYEVLNLPESLTYVYQAAGPGAQAAVNRALDDAGFAPARLHASGGLAGPHRADAASSPLTRALLATVQHDPTWPTSLAGVLTGANP